MKTGTAFIPFIQYFRAVAYTLYVTVTWDINNRL